MRKDITYTSLAFFCAIAVSIAAAPTEGTMLEKEKAAWQAFKDKKPDDFKKLVSANVMCVYAEGMSDMQKELADMQKWDMKSFEISDYKITSDGPNIVTSSYKVKVEGSYDGQDQSGTYNAGSVWHKKGGRGDWEAVFHTNIKEAASAAAAQKKE